MVLKLHYKAIAANSIKKVTKITDFFCLMNFSILNFKQTKDHSSMLIVHLGVNLSNGVALLFSVRV